ncbi:MAG: efflux RND transporter periplasmic adaptor subunit [Burkholderiales bacterium]|nr:efflux RND transporter periplasmic adaptor subunit [Burkholderiales bacterium]
MHRRLLGRIVFFTLLIAGGIFAGLHFLAPIDVVTTKPSRGPAIQAVYATGTVEAGITVRLTPRVAGRLIELKADEGQKVAAGQILARLDDKDLLASVAELEARARYAEQRQQRLQELRDKGFASRDQLQQANSDMQAARAGLARVKEQTAFMTIKAPSNGVIIRRDGEVGDFIAVSQVLFYLSTENAALRIEADVDEEDIAQIQPGQKCLISTGAFPGKVFAGQVAQITPKGDPVARNYRVRIRLPADAPLMIGMTADVNIVVAERQNALLVPTTAVTDNAAWLVRDGRAVRQTVKTGARGAERIEILNGLSEGDTVIAQPPDKLEPGQRVRIQAATGERK